MASVEGGSETPEQWRLGIRARVFQEHHVIRSAWRQLSSTFHSREKLRGFELDADRQCRRVHLHQALLHWREELQRKRAAAAAGTALQAAHVLGTAWSLWRYALVSRRSAREHAAQADRFRADTLVRNRFEFWRSSVAHRRAVRRLEPVAQAVLAELLLRSCFGEWHRALQARHLQRRMADLAARVHTSRILLRGLTAWRSATARRLAEGRAYEQADVVCDHNLTRRVFLAVRRAFARRCFYADVLSTFAEAQQVRALQFAWQVWQRRTDEAHEHRLRGRTTVARKLHRTRVCARHFEAWRCYIAGRHQAQAKIAREQRQVELELLPRCFNAWQAAVLLRHRKRTLQSRADRVYRATLAANSLNRWRRATRTTIIRQELMVTAVAHFRRRQHRTTLEKWRHLCTHSQQGREAKAVANRRILRDALQRLQACLAAMCREQGCLQLGAAHHDRRSLERAWKVWIAQLRREQHRHARTAQAVAHHNTVVLKRLFHAWRAALAIVAAEAREDARAVAFHEQACRGRAFRRWRQHTSTVRQSKDDSVRATHHHQETLARKCILLWSLDATETSKHRQTLERVAKDLYTRTVTRRALREIRCALLARASTHKQERIATWFWSSRLKTKALERWLAHHVAARKQRARIADAMAWRKSRLVREGLARWLQHMAEQHTLRTTELVRDRQQHSASIVRLVRRMALHWRRVTLRHRMSATTRLALAEGHGGSRDFAEQAPPTREALIRGSIGSRPDSSAAKTDAGVVLATSICATPAPTAAPILVEGGIAGAHSHTFEDMPVSSAPEDWRTFRPNLLARRQPRRNTDALIHEERLGSIRVALQLFASLLEREVELTRVVTPTVSTDQELYRVREHIKAHRPLISALQRELSGFHTHAPASPTSSPLIVKR